MSKIDFKPSDEIFKTDDGREDIKREKVMDLPLTDLIPFNGHPLVSQYIANCLWSI
jgi:hypothetical protein